MSLLHAHVAASERPIRKAAADEVGSGR